MPHKRAKASVRNERRKLADNPVDNKGMGQDGPKGLMRLLKMKEVMEENRKSKMKKETKSKPQLKIQPGERLRDFALRVEDEYRHDMIEAHKESKPLTERKKRNREARKEREQRKKSRLADKYGGKDFDDLQDTVKFGDVVDAPPVFNRLPKARGQAKQTLEAKTKAAMTTKSTSETKEDGGYESEEDENMKQLKASHRRKWSNMSAAAKKQLESERERTIASYREKKAKKMAASGLTPSI
ncbi:hypothetical protein BC940DRAFT_346188 [Gongronella butleri]|nr:hypothetical protein BC940DRAFT_346188 [Gongronella butleri]